MIDNIYTSNYVVKRKITKRNKIVRMFVDMKTAFDSIDRGVLGRSLEEKKVSVKLKERIMKIIKKREVW